MRALGAHNHGARAGALAPCSSAPATRALAAPLLTSQRSGRRLCVVVAAKGGKPNPGGTGGSGSPGPSPAEVLASAARQLQAAADKQAAGQPSFAASSQAAAELKGIAAAVTDIRASVLRQEAVAKKHARAVQLQNAIMVLHTIPYEPHLDKAMAQTILTDGLRGVYSCAPPKEGPFTVAALGQQPYAITSEAVALLRPLSDLTGQARLGVSSIRNRNKLTVCIEELD
ncbi:hypothetical protein HYH03_002799 [Edaphochlamys debaryana]|uniref:Uncharacterized protein n=1 Tax=Edaphochlamys debaryana TaxID=47281 RepID=A0A835YK90_9CHLO|nr:hypothetical protein HYH03_002799 [Edaphochlamys debaryana]|eukprot:KAG2499219.1 hypothetical protein HYH03_002799 [Edaphochlamys debaryana]